MDQIETFDLIGFSGNGIISRCLSHVQRKALKKRYQNTEVKVTHVGMAIKGSDILRLPENIISILTSRIDEDMVYIFESNRIPKSMDKVADVFGGYPKGVKLRPFQEILENFQGHVFISHPIFETNDHMLEEFVNYIIENNHLPYEKSVRILMGNVIKCLRTNKQTKSVFCSELIAKLLIQLKVLPDSVNSEIVVPLDFYENPLSPGHTYDTDKEIPILFCPPIQLK